MSVQDLTNTTWVINSTPLQDVFFSDETYSINFTSNNTTFSSLRLVNDNSAEVDIYYGTGKVWNGLTNYPNAGTWANEAYRTITITGGSAVTDSDLITWLTGNATQQGVMKLVDATQLDNDLTGVANAIRSKSGGTNPLAFPVGFISEINNIPSGGIVEDLIVIGQQNEISILDDLVVEIVKV